MFNKVETYILDWLKEDTNLKAWIPYTVEFNDEKVKPGFGGFCEYKLFHSEITLKEKYREDKGILHHEIIHAKQFSRLWLLHNFLTGVWGRYRLWIELEAYREQVKAYNYTSKKQYEWIIVSLYKKYNIGMTKKEIRKYTNYMFDDLIKKD